jgi:two-component sensor histidine kinase
VAQEPADVAAETDDLEARRVEQARGSINRLKVLMDPVRRGDEPQIADLSATFADQMLELLQTGAVELTLDEEGLWMGEGELTGKDLVGRAMLEGLVDEGLVGMTLLPTVPRAELEDLARILAKDWREKRSDEADLEARAWQRGFAHVYLEVRSRRVVSEADEGDVAPEEMVARLIRQLGVDTIDQEAGGALDAEIGAVMDQVRRIGDGSLEEPSLDELRGTRSHRRFQRELDAVSSLLRMQARRLDDPAALRALDECRRRVLVMADIHRQLYSTRDVAEVPLSATLRHIGEGVVRANARPGLTVTLAPALQDGVVARLDRAMPVALIVHELLTNSMQHAWPAGGSGRLGLALVESGEGSLEIVVEDDGVGQPDAGPGDGLGRRLVHALARQAGADLSYAVDGGTRWTLRLSPLPAS